MLHRPHHTLPSQPRSRLRGLTKTSRIPTQPRRQRHLSLRHHRRKPHLRLERTQQSHRTNPRVHSRQRLNHRWNRKQQHPRSHRRHCSRGTHRHQLLFSSLTHTTMDPAASKSAENTSNPSPSSSPKCKSSPTSSLAEQALNFCLKTSPNSPQTTPTCAA